IMGRLAFVGGSPRPAVKPSINDPIQQIKKAVTSLEEDVAKAGKVKLPAYAKPGELLKGSGVNSKDIGIYGPIQFPTAGQAPGQAGVYRSGEHWLRGVDEDRGTTCIHKGIEITKAEAGQWRDNFCEARPGNRVVTCPGGYGHAGQDVWGIDWKKKPGVFPLRA